MSFNYFAISLYFTLSTRFNPSCTVRSRVRSAEEVIQIICAEKRANCLSIEFDSDCSRNELIDLQIKSKVITLGQVMQRCLITDLDHEKFKSKENCEKLCQMILKCLNLEQCASVEFWVKCWALEVAACVNEPRCYKCAKEHTGDFCVPTEICCPNTRATSFKWKTRNK